MGSSFGTWTAYGTIGQIIRYAFLCTNLLSVMLSTTALFYGAWLFNNRSQYAEILAPSLYVDVSQIMIIISLMAIVNSFIAIYSVLRELRCLIYSYSTASFILFFSLFVGGIMGFAFRQKLIQMPLHVKMLTSLKELYGSSDMEAVTYAWNSLQINFKCCGVNNTDDFRVWRTSKWHMHHAEPKPLVPKSCCLEERVDECQLVTQMPRHGDDNATAELEALIYTSTCYMPLKTDLLTVIHTAAWLSIITSLVMLIPAFFAGFYAKMIKK